MRRETTTLPEDLSEPGPIPFTIDEFHDHGTIVTVVGTDDQGRCRFVHCDRRSFAAFHTDWEADGKPNPIGLMLGEDGVPVLCLEPAP